MDDTPPAPPRPRTFPAWLPRVLAESVLIVFSVLLALGVDEWRDNRLVESRAREAVAAISAELTANRQAMVRASEHHADVSKRLRAFAQANTLPDEATVLGGLFSPAVVTDTAWLTAHDTGALEPLPYDVVLALSRAYQRQANYVDLGRAMGDDINIDVRRRGVDEVMRKGFLGFILLAEDFTNREARLIGVYDEALKALAR